MKNEGWIRETKSAGCCDDITLLFLGCKKRYNSGGGDWKRMGRLESVWNEKGSGLSNMANLGFVKNQVSKQRNDKCAQRKKGYQSSVSTRLGGNSGTRGKDRASVRSTDKIKKLKSSGTCLTPETGD